MPSFSAFASTPVRLRSLQADLAVDGAVSITQARRHYQLEPQVIAQTLPTRALMTRPLKSSTCVREVTFVTLTDDLLRWTPAWALAHQAGTAELRHLLGAHRQDWQREPVLGSHRADASWDNAGSLIAVEYDAGYPPATVRAKLGAFEQDFTAVVWGTLSGTRRQHLESRHQAAGRSFVQLSF